MVKDNRLLEKFIKINTNITHSDQKVYYGALSVTNATYLCAIDKDDEFLDEMKKMIYDREFIFLLQSIFNNLDMTTLEFAKKIGLEDRVSEYIYQTLPIVLHS